MRELLLNVAKHAGTDQATVTVEHAGAETRVTVADDGDGFDGSARPLLPTAEGGFGLFSIRERLSILGGRMEIESAPGAGTRVRLILPPAAAAGG